MNKDLINNDYTKKYYDSTSINKGQLRKKYAFITSNKNNFMDKNIKNIEAMSDEIKRHGK